MQLKSLKESIENFVESPIAYVEDALDFDLFKLARVLSTKASDFFFFESLLDEGCYGRFSVLGANPVMRFEAKGEALFVSLKNGETKQVDLPAGLNPYKALQEILPQSLLAKHYAGGLVGYLSYDAMRFMEPSLKDLKEHPTFPSFSFALYLDGLIYNQLTGDCHYFYYGENKLDQIKALCQESVALNKPDVRFSGDSLSQDQHQKIVLEVKEKINQGHLFQCEVGFKSRYQIQGNPFPIYEQLREVNPSPNMFFLKDGNNTLVGASPELLFRLQEGLMETFPLAGTINRGKTEKEDQVLASQLRRDAKEIAEHNMLVDLHRNDIGRVARFDTVRVRRFLDIKRFSHVQHLSSEIFGLIDPKEDMFSALAANFPAGTLSGAPKIEAMKVINDNEAEGRGPYGGAVGHFGFNGDCTFAIPIRSLFISGDQGYIQTSGGIVADSKPESEYIEIQRKLSAFKQVLEQFL